jgi:TM2 domain-containing membrane protein YozV
MTTAASGTKKCPHCAEKILAEARKCKHCGEFLDGSRHRAWNPGIAAVLSLLIPGAGQMYKGEVGQEFGWLICTPIGYAFFLLPGIVLHIACVINAATVSRQKPIPTSELQARPPVSDEEVRKKNIQTRNKQMLIILGLVALGVFLYFATH